MYVPIFTKMEFSARTKPGLEKLPARKSLFPARRTVFFFFLKEGEAVHLKSIGFLAF